MNGYEIYRKAVSLMGIREDSGTVSSEDRFLKIAMDALQHICVDLGIPVPKSFSETITANEKQLDACVCGMAMMLGLSIGDTNANTLFGELYNFKRAAVKAASNRIKDVLPFDDGGSDV